MLPDLGAQSFTYGDLARRLAGLEEVALLPQPGERNAMWSSWNRASVYDETTGKYVDWGHNGDGSNVIREEHGRQVLAEMAGPGVIWRIWSAFPQEGHVKIYLDGQDKPAVDLPFTRYFQGGPKPFDRPSLCYAVTEFEREGQRRGGNNCYVPIPFQKSCKIVADAGWGVFYQITWSSLPEGSRVPTFTMDLSPEDDQALTEVDGFLSQRLGEDPAGLGTGKALPRPGQETLKRQIAVQPKGVATVADLSGARAITAIRVKPGFPEAEAGEALRALTLRMSWDDEAAPAVWSPLGDFFGSCPGINPYRSLPLGVTAEGFYSYWFMPFASRARVEIGNDGDRPYRLDIEICHAPLTRPAADYGRFHAKWHRGPFAPTEPERWMDWPILDTRGRGRFAGVMLHVWNPLGGWWGEGDEKFYVDGEKFPSTFGTGSEDYFGYAWCRPDLFEKPFHSQTHNPYKNKGNVSVNRWQIADNVPFQESFFGTIEKYFPQGSKSGADWAKERQESCQYAAVAYWYLAAGSEDRYTPLSREQRTDYYELPEPPFAVSGALEGESLTVVSASAGRTMEQALNHYEGRWSMSVHLWWRDAKPGDKLTLNLPVAEAGNYEILGQFTKARDYGIVQLFLDGKPLGEPMDFYHPAVVPTGEISLGRQELAAGSHELTAEITGANPEALQRYMFGLDYLLLRRNNAP